MRTAVFSWLVLCFAVHQESECITIQGKQHTKILNRWENHKLIHKSKAVGKRSKITQTKLEETHLEQPLDRENIHTAPFKQKRSSNSSKALGCCENITYISQPGTRKDVLVRNPQNVHFAKKIIVGNRFRQLLKTLYKDHSKDAQAAKRKISSEQSELPGSKGEDSDDKVSIYNIEGKSDASKNKTIIELRKSLLKLLDNVVKKAKSIRNSQQRGKTHIKSSQATEESNLSKTAKTEIQESSKGSRPSSLDEDEALSAKRANYLDLLNFISRMKSTEIGQEGNSRHTSKMPSLDASMLDARDMMTQGSFNPMSQLPALENSQNGNGYMPGNNLQMQEMNLAAQRKLIEDQMNNHLAQLQLKGNLLQNQQEVPPTQNLQNTGDLLQNQQEVPPIQNLQNTGNLLQNQQEIPPIQNFQNTEMSNAMQGLQTPIPSHPEGAIPFGIGRQPLFHQPFFRPRLNPYLPFPKPHPRFRTRLPFFHPMRPRFRFPLENEDEDGDDDEDDDENDYDRDAPPPRHHMRDFGDADRDDDADDEHNDPENDER